MKTINLPLSELVFDFDVYPRMSVDSTHVNQMREADHAGVKFPPYVIEEKTKRVVDGFHRGRKDLLEHGPDHVVECVANKYRNDGELLLDAMRFNADHGRGLTSFDRARCAMKCRKYRVGFNRIAEALGMTTATLKAVCDGRTANVESPVVGDHADEITLKRTVQHMAGQTLSGKQRDANIKLSGMRQVFYVNQILLLLDNDLLDTSDETLLAALERLHERIGAVVLAVA